MVQSRPLKTVNNFLTATFQCPENNILWPLCGLDHVRHWISSWPLNKVCSPCQELQLLLRVHCHANNACYSSTLVKVVSWKMKFWVNYDLEANLAHVMNANIVPFSTLDVSKVFWWPHNHLMHRSHMITSIIKYMSNITCDKEKVNEMTLHMLMLMNAWWCLCSWNTKAKCNA